MSINKDNLILHYDSLDIDDLALVLERDWNVSIKRDLSQLSNIDRWNIIRFIQLLEGSLTKDNVDEITFNDLINQNRGQDKAGLGLGKGSASLTLDLSKVDWYEYFFILYDGISRSDIPSIISILSRIVHVRFHKDGAKCVLNRATLLSNNNPNTPMRYSELIPFSSPDGIDRLCQGEGTCLESCTLRPRCKHRENEGCLLKDVDVKAILKSFVEHGILKVAKENPGDENSEDIYYMSLFN